MVLRFFFYLKLTCNYFSALNHVSSFQQLMRVFQNFQEQVVSIYFTPPPLLGIYTKESKTETQIS